MKVTDPEAFRCGLRGFYGDMWCTQRQPEALWELTHAQVGGFMLQHGLVGAPNLVMGEPLTQGSLIYLLAVGTGGSRFNGQPIKGGNAVCFRPGRDFVLSHDHPHEWFTLQTMHSCAANSLDHSLVRNARRVQPLLNCMLSIMETAAQSTGFTGSRASQVAARVLDSRVKELTLGCDGSHAHYGRKGRTPRERRSILQECHDYLYELDSTPVSVNELAGVCNVSARTLQTVFVEYFGFGPSRFLQFRQLYRVHRELREADPSVSQVSDILLDHGVWNFSHFNRRYKDLYGQTPLQTLKSA